MKQLFLSNLLILGAALAPAASLAQGVGIGLSNPSATLDVVRGTAFDGTAAFRGTAADSHFNYGLTEHTYIRGGKANSDVYIADVAGSRVGVGIGTPNTRLSISAGTTEAKITLWDGGSTTAHYGFGVSGGQLNYHVEFDGASHVFWAGGKNGDGTELLRLTGTRRLGLGVVAPAAALDVARGTAPFGTAALRGTDRISHFSYGTAEDTYIRGGKSGSNVLLNDDGGRVGIGTPTPGALLDVNGSVKLGADGSPLQSVLSVFIFSSAAVTVAPGTSLNLGISYPTISGNGTVYVSPGVDLPDGLVLAYARVAPGQVRFKLFNASAVPCTVPAGTQYYATIVQL